MSADHTNALLAATRAKMRSNVIVQVVVAALLAGLAISRAAHGVVDAVDLVLVVAGASLVSASVGWVNGAFEGAADALDDPMPTQLRARPRVDAFLPGNLWRRALVVTALAGLWSCAGAVVLAAVIGERSVGFPVVAVSLAVLAGGAAVAVDALGRGVGIASASRWRRVRPATVSLHRRAWLHVAVPVGITQLVAQVIISWVLFHDAGRPGAPELTEEAVTADALVVVTILVGLLGAMAGNWGRVDARIGRVAPPAGESAQPIGAQGLVLLGVTAVLLAGPAGWLVPVDPGLAHTLVVRGALAGVLAVVVAGFGYVRGVHAAAAEATGLLPPDRPIDDGSPHDAGSEHDPAPPAPHRRILAGAGVTAIGLTAIVLPGLTATSGAAPLDELTLFAEAEAFAARVEYDIPLPAGTGTAPHVRGEVRRAAGENAQGFAAAPTAFDAVVGGAYANPDDETEGDESRLPNAECVAPGDQTDVSFRFPTDNREDTAGLPATSYATAVCGPGLAVQLRARSSEVGGEGTATAPLGAAASVPTGAGDLLIRTVDGTLESGASARAAGVSVLGGLLTVDSVEVRSATSLTGEAGEAATESLVNLIGVEVAGTRFDLRNGTVVVDGEPVSDTEVGPGDALAPVGDALAERGCRLTVLDNARRYPQGFLFSRGEPVTGIAEDGSSAGSMAGGLLLVCDIPDPLAEPTGFSPQRVQVLIGFAMSSAVTSEDVGGFDMVDVATPTADSPAGPETPPAVPAPSPSADGTDPGPPATPPDASSAVPAPDDDPGPPEELASSSVVEVRAVLTANPFDDSPLVWILALAVWALIGHLGTGAVLAHLGEER